MHVNSSQILQPSAQANQTARHYDPPSSYQEPTPPPFPGNTTPPTTSPTLQYQRRPRKTNAKYACSTSPEYFPFGRPGCGAPLRTDSGHVMADLRQRQKHGPPVHSNITPPLLSPTASPTLQYIQSGRRPRETNIAEYFPFGRPGCGAPLRTDSGDVIADLRLRQSQPRPARDHETTVRQRQQVNLAPARDHVGYHHATGVRQTQHAPARDVTAVRHAPTRDHVTAVRQTHLAPAPEPPGEAGGGVGQGGGGGEMASPRYARGAGPHVDQYILKEKEERRKKQKENVVSCVCRCVHASDDCTCQCYPYQSFFWMNVVLLYGVWSYAIMNQENEIGVTRSLHVL